MLGKIAKHSHCLLNLLSEPSKSLCSLFLGSRASSLLLGVAKVNQPGLQRSFVYFIAS